MWHSLAWAVFGAAYVGAIVFVSSRPDVTPGGVLLVLAAGARLSAYIGATVGEIGFLRGVWLDAARRLAWLEDYAQSLVAMADQPAPARVNEGIRFEHVSFVYPGTERRVLDDIDLELPAGSVVAIVGENGAGKSTLVKLLAKMYEPTSGRILIDRTDLARIPPGESLKFVRAWQGGRTAQAAFARITVEVHPDDYYERFYAARLKAKLPDATRKQYEAALQRAVTSHYVAEQRDVSISKQ